MPANLVGTAWLSVGAAPGGELRGASCKLVEGFPRPLGHIYFERTPIMDLGDVSKEISAPRAVYVGKAIHLTQWLVTDR